ncbi:sensor histidine kinase [Muricoccus radiodurans]|uniref:sensor histidine kinase n=1 Tax=Muricoccus radiodurans TaxID=2231721 RepID=UPI003CF15D83
MRFYALLDRLRIPGGVTGKFFVVAFVGTHVPLLAALAYAMAGRDPDWWLLAVVLVATLGGTALALAGLWALLVPLRRTTRALEAYARDATLPDLPLGSQDEAGRLMRTTQEALVALDTALTAAHGARQEAMEAAGRRERALAEVTHELRTPLNAVLGFAELLQMQRHGPLGHPRYAEFVTDISEAGAHMLSLVESVQRFAAARGGKEALELRRVDLHRLVERALRIARGEAGAQEITLLSAIPKGLMVAADERALLQMILNLVNNAVKYAGPGSRVTVTAEPRESDVEVAVADTGAGMSPEELAVALEPFGRGARARDAGVRGTGLGLPLVRALAELHGGALALDSVVGRGTTARIRLRAAA